MNYQPALLVAVGMWLGRNAAYAQSNKNGRDRAVTTFSASVADTDPEGALTWAMTIQDGGLQLTALRTALPYWLRKNPAAAENWLTSTKNISVETQADLQNMLLRRAKE